jgi:predicted enzyme related to lactoylglutathione lyase
MTDADARGRFVWYDLMTSDPAKAEGFYKKVAGWGTSVWEGPTPYTMWTANNQMIGGVMTVPKGVSSPPHWLAYIAVADVDATAKQVQSLGGAIHKEPTDIPTVGRFAVFADPQGAAFAVFTSQGTTPGHEGPPNVGEFSWHELATSDYAAAFRFYQALFGWEKQAEHDMGPMGIYLLFSRRGQELGGMFNKPAEMPGPPSWLQYIRVDSADAAAERVKANGGTILNGPMEVPGGDRIAQCLDPQGAAFAVHSRAAR